MDSCSSWRGWRACPSQSRQLGEDQKFWMGWRWQHDTSLADKISPEKSNGYTSGVTIRLSNLEFGDVASCATWRLAHSGPLVLATLVWRGRGLRRSAFSVRAATPAPPIEVAVGSQSIRSSRYVGRLRWVELVVLPRSAPTSLMTSLCTAEHKCARIPQWDSPLRFDGWPDKRLFWALFL